MALVSWNSSFEIGIEHIDNQHKRIVELLNKLQETLNQGVVGRELGEVLAGLVDYTRTHFADEEEFMRKIEFPEYDHHKKLHDRLTEQVVAILVKLKKGGNVNVRELMSFLKRWLIEHIVREDKKIALSKNVKITAPVQ